MARTASLALFLGAGVSRPLGFPLSAEILPLILRRLEESRLLRSGEGEQGARLRDLLSRFLPALFEPGLEPPLITDLLSLVDQLLLDGHALGPRLGAGALDELRTLLDRAIAEVLAEPVQEASQGRALLDRLVDWLLARERASLITTNYDLAVESRLYSRLDARQVESALDFGLSWRPGHDPGALVPRPPHPRLRFYKLHGSLDWLRCALCGYLTVDLERGPAGGTAAERAHRTVCGCGYGPLRHIFVAPSMVRELRDPNLLAVWHGALEALRTADEWIVIGYSLPPEDVPVRSLLLRAFRSRPRPPRLRVVETSAEPGLENRYRLLFSEVSFQSGGVEGFVESLAPPLQ